MQTPHHQLACTHLNRRSLSKHATEVWDLQETLAPDYLFLTQIWLNPTSAPDIATAIPEGYKIAHRDLINKPGRRIANIHRGSIHFTTTTDNNTPTMSRRGLRLSRLPPWFAAMFHGAQ